MRFQARNFFVLVVAFQVACSSSSTGSMHGQMNNNANNGDDVGVNNANNVNNDTDAGNNANNANNLPGDAYHVIAVADAEAGKVSTSTICTDCHSNSPNAQAMRDNTGEGIAPFELWQSTMKANSARDPLWRAVMSAEVYRNPEHQETIEATCMQCHAPMAVETARVAGEMPKMADLAVDNPKGRLGADGVSCTMCHGMTDDNFGTMQGFNGNWTLNDDDAMYGPHTMPFENPMVMHTGFTPTPANHITESEHCATCHTLFTETILPDGSISESLFPEQTPYLEWKNSSFASGDNAQSCQDCHMPSTNPDGTDIVTRIARNPMGNDFGRVSAREPFGQHVFVGGNTLIPSILAAERETLLPMASDAAFEATIAATRDQLANRTATLGINNVSNTDALRFDVQIQNLTGHKFPTAYPSRRAWLHVTVTRENGSVLWESGGWNAAGQIVVGEDPIASELVGGPVAGHKDQIAQQDEVQIYQSFMGDTTGTPTVALLHTDRYLKDNRLLPAGFSMTHEDIESTRPHGVEDADFVAGGDTVHFAIAGIALAEVDTVEVELVYQVLGSRWAAELFEVPTPDVVAFKAMYERADRAPELVARTSVAVP